MRRTRAILSMLLAAGMAVHALATRHPDATAAPKEAGAMIVTTDHAQLASVDRAADEDEVVAVDTDFDLIPVERESY